MTITRRGIVCCCTAFIALSAIATPALAHIDPDPTEAPAGSEQSVGFTVEHGCDGSPTVELRMRLPEGVANAVPEPPAGWRGALEDNVISFIGGPLAADVEETFRVRMILPLTPDATIYFPFVQRCEVGEIAWIDIPADDSGTELDEPAPAMTLTAALPGTTQVPATTIAATTTTAAPPTTAAPTSSAPAPVASTDPASSTELTPPPVDPTTALTESPTAVTDAIVVAPGPESGEQSADESGDGGSGIAGTIVLLVASLVVVAGGTVVFLRARSSR